MTNVQELETAITQLPVSELVQFATWFRRYQVKRLTQECAKLDPAEEQAWAELALTLRAEQNYI